LKIKNTLLISGVVLGSLLITGCSSGNSYTRPAPEDSYVAPAPEPAPVVTDEDLYVMALRSHNNYIIDNSSDAELIDVGYTVCEVFAEGYTFEEIAYAIVLDSPNESDAYYEFAGLVVGTASSTLCPQYSTT
jgi:hypothetical protein